MNISASVKDRLMNLARAHREDFNRLLERFVLERFLHRLASSEHQEQFILKGAMLFTVWLPHQTLHRATRDLDLLGFGSSDPERLAEKFRQILAIVPAEDDGVDFTQSTVTVEPIREGTNYTGSRLRFAARLGSAKIPVQVDVGFGDSVFPSASTQALPTLLSQAAPLIQIYPKETVVAEKLHAILSLGLPNSRMKDYFDLRFLADHFEFDGETLTKALSLTLERREFLLTAIPQPPVGLSTAFATDPNKRNQWAAFLQRSGLPSSPLADTVESLRTFLEPVVDVLAAQGSIFKWPIGGPWT